MANKTDSSLKKLSYAPSKKRDGSSTSVVSIDVVRSETAIRYPIHQLAKRRTGQTPIDIKRFTRDGEIVWRVKSPPGPLSYKIDTLIINRRIDEIGWANVPKYLHLGSLSSICRELGKTDSGKSRADVKNALESSAEASINAKFRYRLREKTDEGAPRYKWMDATFSRYGVVFAGQTLPDGREADGVYIIFSDIYRDQILSKAEIRPLDFDYLKKLAPSAQRFYEVMSYRIHYAIVQGSREAWINYSEYCLYTAQSRYFVARQVKAQMRRLHKPHIESGYIEDHPRYIQCTDSNGQADWRMVYTPGPKAYADYQSLSRPGGRGRRQVHLNVPLPEENAALTDGLLDDSVRAFEGLSAVGLDKKVARRFAQEKPEEVLHWLSAHEQGFVSITSNLAGFLRKVLENDGSTLPSGYLGKLKESQAVKAREEAQRLQETAKIRKLGEARAARKKEERGLGVFLKSLDSDSREKFE